MNGRLAAVLAGPAPLFVYASLLFPEVIHVLIGRDPARTSDVIAGWRVVSLPGKVYPGLVPDVNGGAVAGDLLHDLDEQEWSILDAFESDFYRLLSVTTRSRADAWVYALENDRTTTAKPWDSSHFERDLLQPYLISCTRWLQHFKSNHRRYRVTSLRPTL